ncbi:MAG: ABC transporter ATP-binding protein [Anaerolineae bacterium]|jgi:ABC-type lipoprotein export system ATPase subunit|nr:ABC transporter ATP-binding protein [Anaerolineae bacterium]
MQGNTMIKLESVTKVYELGRGATVIAAKDVSLEIGAGEFVAIVGRSGSGKTTVLNLAAGLTRPTAGRVTLDGIDLWRLTDKEQSRLRNQKIGFVFQFPSLLPTLTVLENVILPTTFGPRESRAAARARAADLLERIGLSDKINVYPRQLSAGQQQRVVIARSLINKPELLLADEPTSNLDEKTEMEIVGLFRELHATLGVTVVLVTHTRQLVSAGMRAIEMAEGRVAAPQLAIGGVPENGSRPVEYAKNGLSATVAGQSELSY